MQAAPPRRRDLLLVILVAAVALVAIWYAYPTLRRDAGPNPIEAALERREQLRAAAEARSAAAAAASPRAAAPVPATPLMHARAPADACGFAPALPAGSRDDGLFSAASAMAIPQPAGAGPFLDVAREAAAQGRERDAESAFIVACRLQARTGGDPQRLADMQAELAAHYIAAARQSARGAGRDTVIARAKELLDDASQGYGAFAAGDKVQQLREEVAALDAAALGAARDTSQDPSLESALPARGAAATLVAQDPDLAQLDADLQRLRAQAESVTRDPRGFQRRAAAASARRDACPDRSCLLRWYAARRSQLLDEF